MVYFGSFFANFATVKKLSKNLSVCIVLVLDSTFVPNLKVLGFRSPEISFGEKKTVTHPDIHPAYFAICEPQHSAVLVVFEIVEYCTRWLLILCIVSTQSH